MRALENRPHTALPTLTKMTRMDVPPVAIATARTAAPAAAVQADAQWKAPLELAVRASARWDVAPGSLEPVTKTGNFVFRFREGATGLVRYMRISPPFYRSLNQIKAEVDFVRFLHADGVPVAAPVVSNRGKWVETLRTRVDGDGDGDVDGDGELHTQYVVVWESVGGAIASWTKDQDANCRMIFERGKALGRMHRSAQNYPPSGNFARFHWFEDHLFRHPEEYFTQKDVIQRREYESIVQWMLSRDATHQTYGVCHADFGSGNMFRREDGSMIAFDFDDCVQHWFTYDLAVTIRNGAKMPFESRRKYMRAMLDGYTQEKDMCGDGPAEVERFCHLGALYRYVTILREYDRRHMTRDQRDRFHRRLDALREPPRWC
jgi:Ser/Thr protein kinase RdoA (MazF antagonist)